MSQIRAACVQFSARADKSENVALMAPLVAEAAGRGPSATQRTRKRRFSEPNSSGILISTTRSWHSISGRPMAGIIRGVTPFIFLFIAYLVVLILFPQLSLWLPQFVK